MRRVLWTLFLLADLVLLLLFLGGYAARYVPSHRFWLFELVAIGLPYLSALVALATVVAALSRQRLLLAVHVGALLLAAVRFAPPPGFFGDPAPEASDLTVMTFNLPPTWGAGADVRGRGLIDLVSTLEPDLLALQEAAFIFPNARRSLRGAPHLIALVDSLGYRLKRPAPPVHPSTSLPVLNRIPVEETVETRFLIEDARTRHDTRVVRTRFFWKGREAVLYNLHLWSFGEDKPWHEDEQDLFDPAVWLRYLRRYRAAFRMRAREVEQIRRLLERETLPVIVCGDFNSTPHNRAFHRLTAGLGLRDAFRQAGRGWGATYHSRLPFARIDFVLVSPEWEVAAATVPDARLSDHRPLVVKLRWKP